MHELTSYRKDADWNLRWNCRNIPNWQKRNISIDSEIVPEKRAADLNIGSFCAIIQEKTGEELSQQVLRKLGLIKEMHGIDYPTNALILFSDDSLRSSLFHSAKVECARFKGLSSEEFIDQKSIVSNIATQAEEAYHFVLRHINKGAIVEGVYTVSRWEYPVKAIREVIRNAVVHRDYSLTGKDVKVAIYDDMVEITSPGLLPPSIDYAAMESRQSDARNKVIAPVFKRLGIIDQWGNGLKMIADEMKEYPTIELRWREVGLSLQVQFVKRSFNPTKHEDVGLNVGIHSDVLELIRQNNHISAKEMAKSIGISSRQCERIIAGLKEQRIIERKGSKKTGFWEVQE